MTVTFYVSCRSLRIPTQTGMARLSPKDLLRHGFPGMGIVARQLTDAPQSDGRLLYEIEATDASARAVIVEALAMYAGHVKTLGSAAALYESITGQAIEIAGDPAALYRVNGDDLAATKAEAYERVKDQVGDCRRLFLTEIFGQEMTYGAKQREALKWDDAEQPADPGAAAYPWAHRRATRLGVTRAVVLAEWLGITNYWTPIGQAIEDLREGANDAIAAAETVAEVAAVFPIAWPAP